MKKRVFYKCGYKHQLQYTYDHELPEIFKGRNVRLNFIALNDGVLTILSGYAWDGASGPTLDTPSCIRGSLVHDALYQLMQAGMLPNSFRIHADKELRRVMEQDGMFKPRAWAWYHFVRRFGGKYVTESSKKPILSAP